MPKKDVVAALQKCSLPDHSRLSSHDSQGHAHHACAIVPTLRSGIGWEMTLKSLDDVGCQGRCSKGGRWTLYLNIECAFAFRYNCVLFTLPAIRVGHLTEKHFQLSTQRERETTSQRILQLYIMGVMDSIE